jgi:hypothetical protein
MDHHGRLAWLGVAWVVPFSLIAILAQRPPGAMPADAPAHLFSAARAQKIVEEIARKPHPIGSAESERIRGVLSQKLQELGLKPEIQSPQPSRGGTISQARNILARLEGQGGAGKKAILLSAHYDSVPEGPGAGDNAAGVACVLETLRALKANPPLDRDVIALFDDGEERGFDGSLLFINEHAWAHQVGLVLNIDARGNSGPSIMFETSEQNGWLIRQYASAAPHPFATSFTMDVYRILPNDTDLSIYKRAGLAGLNFAYVGGLSYYHTAEDTPANLSPSTLQHQGENTLATTLHFGRLDLDSSETRQDNVIYTSILSKWILIYPASWVFPMAGAALLLFVAVLILAVSTKRAPLLDIAIGAGVFLLASVAALLVGILILFVNMSAASILHTPEGRPPWLRYDVPILLACSLLLATLTILIVRWPAAHRSLPALSLGALSIWLILSLATALWLPGGSYLFVWPTIGGLLALSVSFVTRPRSLLALIALLLGSIPSLLLIPPLIFSLYSGLSLNLCAPTLLFVVLFLGSILPLIAPLIIPPRAGTLVTQPQVPQKPPDAWISSELPN